MPDSDRRFWQFEGRAGKGPGHDRGEGRFEKAGIPPESVDEICMGQIYAAMQGSLPARQVGMRIGLPFRSGAVSVNQNCSSSMRALEIASHNIMLGKTEIGLVVGVDSMSNAPYLLPEAEARVQDGAGSSAGPYAP